MTGNRSVPFGPGTVSLGLHPLEGASAGEVVAALVGQARAAEAGGFDGVSVSEHHGSLPGYLGQPLVAVGACLSATTAIWSAPAPTLLPLRNPVLLAEEVAWTAAVHPGRVGLVLAAGYAPRDFSVVGLDVRDRVALFEAGLGELAAALRPDGPVGDDPAVVAWAADPPPLLCAVGSVAGVRRAARHGMGVLFSGHAPAEERARLVEGYRRHGGTGPIVMAKRVWAGSSPPGAVEELTRRLRAAGDPTTQEGRGPVLVVQGSPEQVVEEVTRDLEGSGATGLSLRIHLPGLAAPALEEQVDLLGREVVPGLRGALEPGAGLTEENVHPGGIIQNDYEHQGGFGMSRERAPWSS